MTWHEVVALSAVMYNGTVPSKQEIEAAGYGSDPAQWLSSKEHRKNGKPNVHNFMKTKDAKGYRDMLVKGGTRLAQSGLYPMAASSLMLFIQKQCSTFTGMIPVFGDFLILFEWYWYVVCQSGMRVFDSCSGQPLELHLKSQGGRSIHLGAYSPRMHRASELP